MESQVLASHPTTYFVVPCGMMKADTTAGPVPARDLYTSKRFQNTLAAAQAEAIEVDGTVLILSALHGLITLDTMLHAYDVKMGDAGSVTAEQVADQAAAHGIEWGADVYAFLPKTYFAVLDEALKALDVYAADVYEATRGIGDQKHIDKVVATESFPTYTIERSCERAAA